MMLTCIFGSPRSPSTNMSSSNESSLLSTSMSILDGLNYLVWKNQMKAWLQSKGLWQIMMEDIWDSVNKHLCLDMMDPIIFGTFNEFGVKKQVSFPPSELHT